MIHSLFRNSMVPCGSQQIHYCRALCKKMDFFYFSNSSRILIREKNSKSISIQRNIGRFRFSMSDEVKNQKLKEIEKIKAEEKPTRLFAKFKFYFKRYWYIAVPVHMACCSVWFAGFYFAVKSGIDVIGLLQTLHLPESLIEKVKSTPESAGVIVIALLLYKIALPLRYATTLAGIQIAFWTLRKLGKLKTVREVEYGVRSGIELKYQDAIRKLNQRRNRASVANSSSLNGSGQAFQTSSISAKSLRKCKGSWNGKENKNNSKGN